MIKLLTTLTAIFISFNCITAQELSKEAKKELLSEIKEMKKSPEKLMDMKLTLKFSDIVIDQQIEIISNLNKEQEVNDLKINELTNKLADAEAKIATQNNLKSNGSSAAPINHQGLKYRVQIGLFENLDITNLFDDPKYIVHEFVEGKHRYSIGNFNTEASAQAFKTEMRRLGIQDAFVSTYTDGTRTDNQKEVTKVAPPKEQTPVLKNSGFNVKPSYTTSTESDPNRVVNDTVIYVTPPKVAPNDADYIEEIRELELKKSSVPLENQKSSGIKIKGSE